MSIAINFTKCSVGEFVGIDSDGVDVYAAIAKATFAWDSAGNAIPIDSQPVAEEDVYAGEKGTSSVVLEADLVPTKPRVDVIVVGAIELATAVPQIDCTLEVGKRIRKTVRVFGDRLYMPHPLTDLAPNKPRPFARMPIVWERSFGGMDPDHPKTVESRNTFGVGMRHDARALEAKPVANFEDPRWSIGSWRDRPAPVGFGPIARWWQPRSKLAGTYDEKWQEARFPFLPLDFDPRFYNCAPIDQQFDGYLPGEEVRLEYMTRPGHERFRLPAWSVEVTFVDRHGRPTEAALRPDTIVIEPAERRFSLVGRTLHYPTPNILALRQVRVGRPTPGWKRAQDRGKTYLDFRRARTGAAR